MGRLETGPLGRGGGNWLGIELRKRQPEEIGLLSSNVSREVTHATSFESSLTPSWHPWPTGGKEPSWFSSNLIPVWNLFQSATFQKPLASDGTSSQGRLEGQEAMVGFLLVWQSHQDQHKAIHWCRRQCYKDSPVNMCLRCGDHQKTPVSKRSSESPSCQRCHEKGKFLFSVKAVKLRQCWRAQQERHSC